MSDQSAKVEADRRLLEKAEQKGGLAKLGTFVRLSGPGWLQSAITLGGGSLAGGLFLGALGGTNMLWLQLVAIAMGVVMLSAISYVTLSTGQRPLTAINTHINPVLGWGWLIATSLANMIWCMPQFSLCYGSLTKNLSSGYFQDTEATKFTISAVILAVVTVVVILNARRGVAARVFDWLLKGLVGMVVICFFGVVIYLGIKGSLDAGEILAGFIPDLSQWQSPTGKVAELLAGLSAEQQQFWSGRVVSQQRVRMIGAAATAVGINMTFLMPYSMLHRGWDKPFRGLARFDLATGMAIPYVVVTTCVVIAAANAFNGKAEEEFLSKDPAVFESSRTFAGAKDDLLHRVDEEYAGQKYDDATRDMAMADKDALLAKMAALPEAEKRIAASMVQRSADELAQTLAPLIGDHRANLVFGLGVFGMGFSTIIILMLINGFVFCEAAGKPDHPLFYSLGCVVAGVVGALWPLFWTGPSQFWLAIVASSFGMILLPIAYVTFLLMMNSRTILGDDKPTGAAMVLWNVLMGISVAGAIAAAGTSLYDKIQDPANPLAGWVVSAMLAAYLLLVLFGFVSKSQASESTQA